MPRVLVVCSFVLLAVSSLPAQQGVLRWNNDDVLGGTLIGYEDQHLHWRSDQFTTPFEIHGDYLSAADFAVAGEDASPAGEFRLETSTGDVLFANLESIDAETVVVRSQRLGRAKLKRELVRELRQLRHTQVLYDGPRWLDGWRVLKAGRRLSEWESDEHGHLRTAKYGGELFHDLPQLDVAEINLVFRWSGKPGFQIDFSSVSDLVATRPKPRLRLVSWGDDVVAQSALTATDFVHLLKLTDRQTEIRLQIVWDNVSGEVVIHGQGGRLLGRTVVGKADRGDGFGILIKNRSDDLVVEQVRLSKWNGATKSEDRQPGESYVRLSSGQLVRDEITTLEADSDTVQLKQTELMKLSDLAIAEFATARKGQLQPHNVRFADGTELSGEIASIDEDHIHIDVPFCSETISASRAGIEAIRFFQGRTREFDFHLISDTNRLSGNLRPVAGSNALGWAPIGSRYPVQIEINEKHTIERRMGRSADLAAHTANEVVYLRDNSVLIGDLESVTDSELVFTTPYTGRRQVPLDEVKATEMLKGSGRISFTNPSWELLRATQPLQRSQEYMEVVAPVSMRDLSLYHRGRITFGAAWDEDFVGLLTIHVGTSDRQPRNSIARFTFAQERLSARCLVNASASRTLPPIPERRATISIEANDDKLVVWVNGIRAIDATTKTKVEHTGLWIQCNSAGGPLARGDNRQQRKPRLIIERLRVGDGANRLGAGFASSGDLEMMLRLPRNRLQSAPKVVLCSTNGDLLRGELLAMGPDSLSFKSRYEEVSMPRSDVSALVWLAAAEEPGPRNDETVRVSMHDGSVVFLKQPTIIDDAIVGRHGAMQECTIPLSQVLKIQNGNENWQSIADAVDWRLERTPEPSFADGDVEQGLASPLVGHDVRDVVIPMLKGEPVRLDAQQGKVVVLDFWASWCAPCLRSLPKLVAVAESFPPEQVQFIAVNQEESPFTINSFLANRDLDMKVGLDTDGGLSDRFLAATIPQTVIIGHDGKVERVFIGAPSSLHAGVLQAIQELLPPSD